jgi:hypothetical protein
MKMQKLKLPITLTLMSVFLFACSKNDDAPEPVIEQEIITTMTVTLVPEGNGSTITLKSQDLDGDGPNAPVITVSGNLQANATYNGSIVLLNETETPPENITEEIEELADEHQFFYSLSGSLTNASYSDQDGSGNPLGIIFTLESGAAGSGSLGITLRHEPKKPNDGTLSDAGGETDIAQTFNVTVE